MAKKKEREFVEKKQETTKKGTRLTSGTIGETTPKETGGTYTKQKKFKGVESPTAVRLQELSKGKGFIAAGTPEYEQLQREFPMESRQFFDPEERAFMNPGLTPRQIDRERLQFEQQEKQRLEQEGLIKTAEDTGVFEERPERVELSPSGEELEEVTKKAREKG